MKRISKVMAVVLCFAMLLTSLPLTAFAAVDASIQMGVQIGTNGYYNVISRKDWVLVPGAATETELVINNAAGSRRQVLHVIEVDPSNPDVSIIPGYYAIDKDLTDMANQQAAKLTDMAAYYEDTLGYNVVGGMNTDLTYSSNAPRVLVYNGKDLRIGAATQSILCVYKEADGTISCDVKAYNKATVDAELASGRLLHAVGVSFGMVVKNGELVKKTEERVSAAAARSMVGVKADGTLVICMNDGRGANDSIGLCDYEEGEIMLALGCEWAANCDGGGSSTFLTKRAGEDDFTMRSVPCDGAERPTLHGIFVTSNVAPTGELDVVNVASDYDYFAPGTTYTFGAEAIDTHGYAMDMPADVTWALSDASFGTVANSTFVSSGKTGAVDVQVISGGKVVGTKTINVANPTTLKLTALETVIPYTTAEKVRTIALPIVAKIGEADVCYDTNAFDIALSNAAAGTLNGFNFTATSDTSISDVTVTMTYKPTNAVLTYKITFGKGSEILWDFEDNDLGGFLGQQDAYDWQAAQGIAKPLDSIITAGNMSNEVHSKSFISTKENGGQVHNGQSALGYELDMRYASFNGWVYANLYNVSNVGDSGVLRDVANDNLATTLGVWVYIPEGFYTAKNAGAMALRGDFVAGKDAASAVRTNFDATYNGKKINALKESDIPENRWIYAQFNLASYNYVSINNALSTANYSPCFARMYVKPSVAQKLTYYFDDFTLDYSSAVDDRNPPVISETTYCTADTNIEINGQTLNTNKVSFNAKIEDFAASNAEGLDYTSAKIYVDGVALSGVKASGTMLSAEDVVLANGEHTITFEVADKLGNATKVSKTLFVDCAEASSTVTLSGHKDGEGAIEAGSVYYVDVVAQAIEDIDTVKTTVVLNTANTWILDQMTVADGFDVSYTRNGCEDEFVTLTIKKTGTTTLTGEQTLVTIPVRVWAWDETWSVNVQTGATKTTAERYAASNQEPIVNVEADVVYGAITYTDATTGSFSDSFAVATKIDGTQTSGIWHTHDAELTVLNQDATCTVDGYADRTYCETCQSVVDFGTTIEASGHEYVREGNAFVCACGAKYALGTGLVEMNDALYCAIAGKLVTGWQLVDGNYYYFDTETYTAIDGRARIDGHVYEFENNILVMGQVVRQSNGLVYMWAGSVKASGWFTVKDKTYLVLPNRTLATNREMFQMSTNSPTYICDFDASGVLIDRNLNGVVEFEGNKYFLKDSLVQYGVQEFNGDLYYFRSSGVAATGKYRVAADKTNGLLKSEYYVFGEDGKLIKQGFSTAWDGVERYIVNGQPAQASGLLTIGEDIYCIGANGAKATGLYNVKESQLNGILPEAGNYIFAADGKLIRDGWSTAWDGLDRHIVMGRPDATMGIVEFEGGYYYIRSSYQKATGKYYVPADKLNGFLTEQGYYLFDENGRMVMDAWSTAWDGEERRIVNGRPYQGYGLTEVDGEIYYIRSTFNRAIGKYFVPADKLNGFIETEGYCLFDSEGRLVKDAWSTGWDGEERRIVMGRPYEGYGLTEVNGDIYYIRSNFGRAFGKYYVPADKLNGFLDEAGYCLFDEEGRLIKNGWSTAWDGVERHIVMGRPDMTLGLVRIGDDVYYIRSTFERARGKYFVPADKLNGIVEFDGIYDFGTDGKMIDPPLITTTTTTTTTTAPTTTVTADAVFTVSTVSVGAIAASEQVTVDVYVDADYDLTAVELKLGYDNTKLEVVSVEKSDFLSSFVQALTNTAPNVPVTNDENVSELWINAMTLDAKTAVNEKLVTITFVAKEAITESVSVYAVADPIACDADLNVLSSVCANGGIAI